MELIKLQQETILLEQSLVTAQPNSEEYLIIVSADKTLPEAQFELGKVSKLNPEAAIYKKYEYYCTVYGKYNTLSDTKSALIEARKIAADAYYVRYSNWCKKGITTTKDCFVCQN